MKNYRTNKRKNDSAATVRLQKTPETEVASVNRELVRKAAKKLKRNQSRAIWILCLCLLSTVVGIDTYSSLTKTAEAYAGEPACGKEEHTHDSSCYAEGNTILICDKEEDEGHVHDESCYVPEGTLICGKEEHVHTDDCYKEQAEEETGSEDPEAPVLLEEQKEKAEAVQKESKPLEFEEMSGNTRIQVSFEDADAFDEDDMPVTMTVSPIEEGSEEYEACLAQIEDETGITSAQKLFLFDISFISAKDGTTRVEPSRPAKVSFTSEDIPLVEKEVLDREEQQLNVIHIPENGEAEILDSEIKTREEEADEEKPNVTFEAESFSIFGVVYTVDFHWTVSGESFDYSLPGGGVILFSDLVKQLGLDLSNSVDSYENETDALNGFMSGIETVEFSAPELLGVYKAEEDTTVGEIRERHGIQSEYSSDLSEKEKREIDAVLVPASDWVLISVKPFATEETLTVKMKNGDVFEILVTDAQIVRKFLTKEGENCTVTVTFGDDAGIPDDADLAVREILEGSEAEDTAGEYETYLEKTRETLGLESGVFAYARIFDIKIVNSHGDKVEILAPVDVKIELGDSQNEAAEEDTMVVHFADGADRGEEVAGVRAEGDTVKFRADGFSAYAIVQGPGEIPPGWETISTFDELIEKGSTGVYIGHTSGYYFMNSEVTDAKGRVGIAKTRPAKNYPDDPAAVYYFERASETGNQVYVYCLKDKTRQYVHNGNNNSLRLTEDESEKTAFTVTVNKGVFTLNNGDWYWNMQGGSSGTRFCCYNSANDANNSLKIWSYEEVEGDPYEMDGKTFGLMFWSGGAAGKALMNHSSAANALDAKSLTVMSTTDNKDRLFVPNESDITLWTFRHIAGDRYYLMSGSNYLRIDKNGLSLVSEPDELCEIQLLPGTGIHAGQISLKSKNGVLSYSGTLKDGFSAGGSAGKEWLNLVEVSELSEEYFMTYSANKISVSDPSVTNGSRIIVYTRDWNEKKKQYEYYAVGSDGTLIPVYESGDTIEWVSGQLNKLLWNFVEYYWEGTDEPNYYYELYNQYSEKYIAPQVSGGQILSDETIGINLNGRRDGKYFSSILAWDEGDYAYVGLKVEDGKVVSCPKSEAMDFYFAVMQDLNVDDALNEVDTVEHTQYGITMKMQDFGSRKEMSDYLGDNEGGVTSELRQGLLSTDLSANGYPTAAKGSLAGLYNNPQEVNHLFIQSTYDETGYFEYDSTQNFATLKGKTGGDFTVYKELGTNDSDNRNTLKHGQFFPYNDLAAGVFASVNTKNLYSLSRTGGIVDPLPDSDPRKYENLYNVANNGKGVDYFFGMELEASFTQTPDGLDAWGHDIIFEFTGDDDFWLYVDGELVIDLGGIHSAVAGKVNFRTGEVNVNGTDTTLKDLFYQNFLSRNHTASEAQAYADSLFVQNGEGGWVFRDYTNHSMRLFYMERGAFASNLHMRFNLAAVKKGTVELNKKLDGVDTTENVLAEFPYQIFYKMSEDPEAEEYRLTNSLPASAQTEDYVLYKDTVHPVTYKKSAEIGGVEYQDVFFLKPDETAVISFPEGMTTYRITECGVSTQVYSRVTVNGTEIPGTERAVNRKDYGISYATSEERSKVNYVNEVNTDALKTLTIDKQVFAEDGVTRIHYPNDTTEFSFRLYLWAENDAPSVANMKTYHVKDPDGNYCRWDKAAKTFVKIGEGIKNYDDLTDEQKILAGFTTSVYGAITKIPADHTVEIRDVLAGTMFRVQERPDEIPDGYSFQKYILNSTPLSVSAEEGAEDTVTAEKDPHVDVCNLKGWGMRLYKLWSDADYMLDRSPVYFAVYCETAEGTETLVPGSLKKMPYGTSTLYWHWPTLPSLSNDIDKYAIREVTVSPTPEYDADGNLINADSLEITPVSEGGNVTVSGRQKGETQDGTFTYTVHYTGKVKTYNPNVLNFTIRNERPGISIKKVDWDGNPLKNAVFELKHDDTLVGTFTSDVNGLITIAFLTEGIDYTLTEISSPQGYHGLQGDLTIRADNGEVTVSCSDDRYYTLVQPHDGEPAVLKVRNKPYLFRAIKIDGDTEAKLPEVHFALHRQITVDEVTQFDLNPMPGYEDLITDGEGILPKIDETLPSGTYQLREKKAPGIYKALPAHVEFTVSETGQISLLTGGEWVSLEKTDLENGKLLVTLTVRNYIDAALLLKKADENGQALPGAVFRLEKYRTAWETVEEYSNIDLRTTPEKKLTGLSAGLYRLEETAAPNGYVVLEKYIYFRIDSNGRVTLTDESGEGTGEYSHVTMDESGTLDIMTVENTPGAVLPEAGGQGTGLFTAAGLALILAALVLLIRKQRQAR